ncbi:MAG TPA: MraY family glycosyltransferase [Bryobacteraceae bacterium]|jgi:UDP-GlcNAc:undecaprenyl-phosphate GlcNAc-1-phosphate transferase|nr:MraY family glycosyltransferase [Bryobacteraceae bacterium]
MSDILWMAGSAFISALVLTPILRDVFRAYDLVDRPGRRKVHAYPIPRLGGIAIAAAYVIALLRFTHSQEVPGIYKWPAWEVLPGAGVIFLIGILDDVFTLRPLIKLGGQIAAAGVAYAGGLRVEALFDVALPPWISLAVTIGWLLITTNAFNLIDGLDALCTSLAIVAAATFFFASGIRGDLPLQHASLLLAGALLGFLCFNLNPATMFLGDSGALSIGFLLGCFGVIWTRGSEWLPGIAVPLLALSVPLLDAGLAVVRRYLAARRIFAADRGHVHHRLLDRGMTPRRVALLLFLWALLAAAFAVLISLPALHRWQGFVILGFCASAWAGVRQLDYAEFDVAARLIFQGQFRQTVQAQARLKNLTAALARSHNENDWWEALTRAAQEAGWSHIRWIRDSGSRERSFDRRSADGARGTPQWSFRIALGAVDTLEIEGPVETPGSPLDLQAFAQSVRSSFKTGSGAWSEPKLSA